jgi:hypothetical protein
MQNLRLQSLQVLARWVLRVSSSLNPIISAPLSVELPRRERLGEVDEDGEEILGLRAMIVLLPLQVHLQNNVAEAVDEIPVSSEERLGGG